MTEPPDLEVIDLQPGDDAGTRHAHAAETVRRRRGPVVIASLVIIALVAVTVANRTHHASPRTASPTTDASHTNIDLNDQPSTARTLFPFHVDAQILTGGASGLRLFDTDTGTVSIPNVTGLPPGPVTVVAHSGATVAVRAAAHLYWFSLPNGVAHRLDADTAFASARPGHLWLAGQRQATEVPGDSDRLPRTRVATSGPAIGATSGGLLVATQAGVVLEPSTGAGAARLLLRPPATVIGVHTDRVAWVTDDCGILRCPVHITEVATGVTSSWVQLAGRPSPLAIAGTSAVFSPDGSSLVIVEPNDDVTAPSTLVVTNLRTRATIVVAANRLLEQPARPGGADATGTTVDWTPDGEYVVIGAPQPGADQIGVMDPSVPLIVPSSAAFAAGTSLAAIAASSVKSIHPRHAVGPVDTGGPTALGLAGLRLIGADRDQVDVLDLTHGRVTTFAARGPVPNPEGPNSIARVVGGWLVVRTDGVVVDLLPDGGGPAREVGTGSQVFSSDNGRHAWIVSIFSGPLADVAPYDPVTGRLGHTVRVGWNVAAAINDGLVGAVETGTTTQLVMVDPSGRVRQGPVLYDTHPLEIIAGAATRIAFTDQDGLHVYDVATGADQVVSPGQILAAALSPDGTAIAWIESDATQSNVLAERLGGVPETGGDVLIGGPADRVLVADNGTVLYTNGVSLRRGRVDANGSSPVTGLAPDPAALLALG